MPLNRRDFLTLVAGGGAAATAGCRPRGGMMQRRVDFDGCIRGEDPAACHRLARQGLVLPPPGAVEADRPLRDVVVVGAGLSGLAAAWALARAGVEDLIVLERADDIGGVSRGGHLQGHPCPWGAHYVGLPDPDSPVMMHLLADVGVIIDFTADHRPVLEPRYRVRKPEVNLFHGHTHSRDFYPWALASQSELREVMAFKRHMYRWSRWRDARGRPAFQLPVAYATDDERVRRLDFLTMAEYLDAEGFSGRLLRDFVDDRLTDEYGCVATEISAYAALLFWSATGGETRVPRTDPTHARALAWPEGNMFLARRLADRLPRSALRTSASVARVQNVGDEVHVTQWEPASGRTLTHRARYCIFAAPKLRAERLLPELTEAGRHGHDALCYSPWLVANLLLTDCPEHDAKSLAWDNLVHRSWSLGFVNSHHFVSPGKDPDMPFLLTFYACFSGDRRDPLRRDLLELDWATWARLITDELEHAMPDARRQIERLDVWRWGHGMVRPAPGLLWGGTRDELTRPLGRIHFAGNDAAVLPLYEEAVHRGVAAAEEVLARRGRPFTSLIEPTRERLD